MVLVFAYSISLLVRFKQFDVGPPFVTVSLKPDGNADKARDDRVDGKVGEEGLGVRVVKNSLIEI